MDQFVGKLVDSLEKLDYSQQKDVAQSLTLLHSQPARLQLPDQTFNNEPRSIKFYGYILNLNWTWNWTKGYLKPPTY